MIEKIKEQNVWDILKNDNKPVVLYGMGLGAEKIMAATRSGATRCINTAKFAKNTMILMLCFALRVTLTA